MTVLLEIIYSFIGSLCFGVIFNIKGKKLFFAALGGGISQTAYVCLGLVFESDITTYFFATIIIAVYSEIFARLQKSPATIFLVPAIIPLVPGSLVYYSMEKVILGDTPEFVNLLLETLAIAGALAMGILIVSSINKLLRVAKNKRIFFKRKV